MTRNSSTVLRRIFLTGILLTSVFSLNLFAADKTDEAVMNNGDHLLGEIKGLEFGQLEFKASYMATSVQLDWTKVRQLKSTRRFRVEFMDGTLHTGTIQVTPNAPADQNFGVTQNEVTTARGFLEVVSIEPLERSIW